MTTDGPFDHENDALEAAAKTFLRALQLREDGQFEAAEAALRRIIAAEPRLAEPHLELGRILLDTDRFEEAEDHAREGLALLTTTGLWLEDVDENGVRSIAHALLAEVLRRRIEDDDLVFGEPDRFKAVLAEARHHFEVAAALDPSYEHASWHAFFLGVDEKGERIPVDHGEDDLDEA